MNVVQGVGELKLTGKNFLDKVDEVLPNGARGKLKDPLKIFGEIGAMGPGAVRRAGRKGH